MNVHAPVPALAPLRKHTFFKWQLRRFHASRVKSDPTHLFEKREKVFK